MATLYVTTVASAGSTFSPPSRVQEIPGSWYLTDFPAMEYIIGVQEGMPAVGVLEDRWRAIYTYAATQEEECCFALTLHPQTSGRAHMIPMLDRLISYMKANRAAFMTLSEIADATEIPRLAQAGAAQTG